MNREILFKAKRKDNGEWVEGLPSYDINGNITKLEVYKKFGNCWIYTIDPDTLCQYTGLTDKNGQKIWENDIVSINAYSYYEPEDDYFGVVKYSSKDACWCLCGEVSDVICECFGSYTTEINKHGNIFDNPELLEVG